MSLYVLNSAVFRFLQTSVGFPYYDIKQYYLFCCFR